MSAKPQTLSEVRALAEQSLGDPESSHHFQLALGVTPEAFAALDEQAQAMHLQQLQAGEQNLQGNVCRMDDLVGKDFKILAFRDLPLSHQLSIAQYMPLEEGAEGETPASLEALLPAYLLQYGDDEWGVLNIAAERLKQSVMADEDRATGNDSWEEYAAAYCAGGDVPHYGPDNRWPVLLSPDNYETLLDGWHRMHSYMRSGFADVPALFAPGERHYELIAAQKGSVEYATHNRYALAVQDAEAGLIWSVGGVWSASLLSQSPALMTGPEVDAFHKKHPNAHIVDVIVYREACEAYNAGFDSVLDHNERSTPESRHAARKAGIESLVRAGFPENALEIGKIDYLQQGNVSNHSDQAAQAELLGRNQAAIAERAFEAYNFGEGVAVTGASGWEYYAAGHERSRAVYVEVAIDDGKENSTTQLGFTVRFDPQTGALAEAYASDYTGQIWGSLPQGNVKESLQKASILLEQIRTLQDQVDALLSDPAKKLIERIATAQPDQFPELKMEVSSFPNDGFYRSEIRTALTQREIELRSPSADDSPSPNM